MIIKDKSYAKINLSLDVTGIREDGYHLISTVMQTVELADIITIEDLGNSEVLKIEMTCNLPYVPTDSRNSAVKAASIFFEHCGICNRHIRIDVQKRIPVAAGLGGSSTNGAAVLTMLDRMYDQHLSLGELIFLAQKIGADVPFFIEGGTVIASGIGEILNRTYDMPDCYILIAKYGRGANSKNIYGEYDLMDVKVPPQTQAVVQALSNGDLSLLSENLGNMLAPVTMAKASHIGEIVEKMKKYGALGAQMSGSGSAVYGIFNDIKTAENAYCNFKREYNAVELFITTPHRV